MHIEAPKKNIGKSSKAVYDFLLDVKNFESLMPENISKFEVLGEDKFVFALKGMPEIILKLKEQYPHDKIVFGAASDKLPFTLTANIDSVNDNESQVTLSFEGEFNAMMAMMVKNPIINFMGSLSRNLEKI